MADISRLSRIMNGIQRQVDLSSNTLVLQSLKVGGGESNSELTKLILDNLIALQGGEDANDLHHHDGRYFRENELSSTAEGEGASLIGIHDAASQFVATDVENALAEALEAAQAAQQDIDDHTNGSPSKHNADQIDYKRSAIARKNIDSTTTEVETALSELDDAIGNLDSTPDEYTPVLSDVVASHLSAIDTALGTKIPASEKGAANGVATLSSVGKVPTSQLPALAITEVFVVADIAARNALVAGADDGQVQEGDVAIVLSDSGFLNNRKSYIYDGTGWQILNDGDAVDSVNGQTGTVVLDTDDVAEGSSNLYWTETRFDASFDAKDTDDLTEGSGSLYFTETRAKDAAVVNSTEGSETDQAASVAAMKQYVEDQIATKDEASEIGYDNTDSGLTATDVQAALDEIEGRVDDLESRPTESLERPVVAGESLTANTIVALRWADTAQSETGGRVRKASKDASVNDNFYVVGLAYPSASKSSGDSLLMVKLGKLSAPSHGLNVGKPLFLDASGALTQTAPTAPNEALVRVGMVEDANTIDVQIEIIGVN